MLYGTPCIVTNLQSVQELFWDLSHPPPPPLDWSLKFSLTTISFCVVTKEFLPLSFLINTIKKQQKNSRRQIVVLVLEWCSHFSICCESALLVDPVCGFFHFCLNINECVNMTASHKSTLHTWSASLAHCVV